MFASESRGNRRSGELVVGLRVVAIRLPNYHALWLCGEEAGMRLMVVVVVVVAATFFYIEHLAKTGG